MKYLAFYKMLVMSSILWGVNLNAQQNSIPSSPHIAVITAEKQTAMPLDQVLQRLKEGNQRFVSGKMKNRGLLTQAHLTLSKQYPVAVILSCMDARTPPEIIFDQGIGDIFAIRIAGNVQNEDILGSMEFGTKIMGAKLIAVIGHTSCGAMRGACEQTKLGYLTGLLQKIQPAIQDAASQQKKYDCASPDFIDQVAASNVLNVMKQIATNSPIIANLVKQGKIKIVGGLQNLATGEVKFFEN